MPPAFVFPLLLALLGGAAWLFVQGARQRRPSEPQPSRAASARPAAAGAGQESSPPPSAPAAEGAGTALTAAEIFTQLNELALGVSPLGEPPAAEVARVTAGVSAALESVAEQSRYAPRRPLLLPHLLRAVRDDEISRREIAAIIARDPALTGSLLKLANSAFYRISERPVESIDRAVALLGTDGIRALVAAALVQPVFRLAATEFPAFPEIAWEHTCRCAAAAEAHAAVIEDTDPFAAQVLGLILGLGTIVAFRMVLDQYGPTAPRASPAVVAALVEEHAAPVAARIAASWELSGRILGALADQTASGLREPTSLGRSLQFGRLIGALAILRAQERVTDETAKASMMAAGAAPFQFERIWSRLTGRTPAVAPERRGAELRR